jgi:hypothetical protein
MQNPMRAVDQKIPMPTRLDWSPRMNSDRAKTTVPARIHGRRRPKRDVVRSDIAPVNG